MNVFIAGASSFSGKYITRFLIKKKVNVLGTFNKHKVYVKSKYFSSHKIDLTKSFNLKKRIDFLIHISSHHKIEDFKINPQKKIKKNILMTKNILDYCTKNNIKKIIFFSTIDIDKVDFPKKKINYIKSKIQSEKIYLNFKKKNQMKIIILRLPAIIGKNCNQNFFSTTYERLKKNKRVKLWNSKDLYDNFLHIEDLSKFIYFIISKSSNLNKSIIECKSKNPLRLKETILLLKKKLTVNQKFILMIQSKKEIYLKIRININLIIIFFLQKKQFFNS